MRGFRRLESPRRWVFILAPCLALFGCQQSSSHGGVASTAAGATAITPAPGNATSGTFKLLTYNVAGLPQGISSSNPVVDTPQISPKLNFYDIALCQEDFWYHTELASQATHRYQSVPLQHYTTLVGDGLDRFSRFPFSNFQRVKWSVLHGIFGSANDALSSKGFSFARTQIVPGVTIDIYNLHADAGSDPGDMDARQSQFQQLRAFIHAFSVGQPMIVAGDTNDDAGNSEDAQTLTTFLASAGVKDVGRTLGKPERIDRVFFRGGPHLTLTPVLYRLASEMVDANGGPLSDHEAVNVDFHWQVIP